MAATGEMPMATSALHQHHQHLQHLPYDSVDLDSYINYEQTAYLSPTPSSASSSAHHQLQQQQAKQIQPSQPLSHSPPTSLQQQQQHQHQQQQQQQALFSAPSHQYDAFKQQTGIPMGALPDTMAMTGVTYSLGGATFAYPPDAMMAMPPQQAPAEYIYPPRFPPSLPLSGDSDMSDIEPSSQTTMHGLSLPPSQTPVKAEFVDPNALGGHELSPVIPPASNQLGRVYPGIHQQQAARAKAAQQLRQQEMVRRQQQQQQQHQQQQQQHQQSPQSQHSASSSQQQAGQQQPPQQQQKSEEQPQQPQQQQQQPQSQDSRQAEPTRQAIRSQAKPRSDPVVEERISRLLQQMRQSSTASADDMQTPTPSLPHVPKLKKDEDDMDEDERLLASEEGKKLSSKERRQLRNKVSARAFRSRRKEYIGQLEGEVTAKTNEANDLRLQNRALLEENARLTDLTRMLLASPHFASFLNDISVNGLHAPVQNQAAAVQSHTQIQPTTESPDVPMPSTSNANSMPTISEQPSFDFAAPLEVNGPGWNSGIDMNFNNASVFAVLDVPEGPAIQAIDTSALSGKDSHYAGPLPLDDVKDIPTIEMPPVERETESTTMLAEVDIDESDPSFALFLDQLPTQKSTSSSRPPVDTAIRDPRPEKAHAIDMRVVDHTDPTRSNLARFELFCARIEGAYQRVCQSTSHLD